MIHGFNVFVKTEKRLKEARDDSEKEHERLEKLYNDVKTSWLQAKEDVRKLESENSKLIGVVANLSNAIMDLDNI